MEIDKMCKGKGYSCSITFNEKWHGRDEGMEM